MPKDYAEKKEYLKEYRAKNSKTLVANSIRWKNKFPETVYPINVLPCKFPWSKEILGRREELEFCLSNVCRLNDDWETTDRRTGHLEKREATSAQVSPHPGPCSLAKYSPFCYFLIQFFLKFRAICLSCNLKTNIVQSQSYVTDKNKR